MIAKNSVGILSRFFTLHYPLSTSVRGDIGKTAAFMLYLNKDLLIPVN